MTALFELLPHGGQTVEKEAFGIPFSLAYDGARILPFDPGATLEPGENEGFTYAYLVGMVNRSGWCSEWWGQNEVRGCYNKRIFIGDQLGSALFIYKDCAAGLWPECVELRPVPHQKEL